MTRKERDRLLDDLADRMARHKALLADGAVGVKEAVEVYGVGRTVLFEKMKAGELPVVKLGKKTLIPRAALVALLARNLAGGATPGRAG
ncbi:MAG: helix-turn-helix domain-containing protein [Gemmataceae bacterium]|nr:helix-turn-helix domain-containing protein [Gemmataceae bacterium]